MGKLRFFAREKEISKLHSIRALSKETSQMTVVTGRRRIGKTSLILKSLEGHDHLYFFVSRKAEEELCNDYMTEIAEKLKIPMLGHINRFSDIFSYLMELSKTRPMTVFIDEFQDFLKVNKSVYSDMQRIWDLNKDESKMNLILCGSINTLMHKLFRNHKEPLYGRQTAQMNVKPFTPSVLKQILSEYNPDYTNEDLLSLYLYTGGVAKYVEQFVNNDCLTAPRMLDAIMEEDSLFLTEGKTILIEEFGKDYGKYFSILSLIANGHNTRSDLESILKTEIGGYISNLCNDYGLIAKHQPLLEKSPNKSMRYTIDDHFLRFWFRFLFKYNYMIEIGAFNKLRQIIERDYTTYSGHVLESYFREKLIEQGDFTMLGYWHDRKGENEIDLIAVDEIDKRVVFHEIKRQKKEIDIPILRAKADVFLQTTKQFKEYDISYRGLSMEDM